MKNKVSNIIKTYFFQECRDMKTIIRIEFTLMAFRMHFKDSFEYFMYLYIMEGRLLFEFSLKGRI